MRLPFAYFKILWKQVQQASAEKWCKTHGSVELFETSAKDNVNVETAFQVIAKAAASNDKEEEM